ncbi:thiol reductant ABC exporter subunit CydD [Frondihabitans australicus]|uniref:ATP-binding cassette subfamily C protein CydD n=1 Tax=Frondihabitans australicus TaxID=386892 RepID=A0A495ICZ6_9MICO|nr:thiol reductant ABC exporter subunit CydD [Frondihabitans australicus]RKR73877.1 ATP-binding cassette subfamily C protein CydD [Frondihabitans australicus]
MKPLDPRLLRDASAVRTFLAAGAVLGILQTALTVAFAFVVSGAVVAVVDRHPERLAGHLVALAVVIALRSALGWALEATAARTAVRVKSQLRDRLVDAIVSRGRTWRAAQSSARLATLVGPGLDALDGYFARYLPQLILTALATPLLVVVMFTQDVLSGVIVVCCLPVIPVFMILIGWTTRAAQDRQWDRLARLATSFLDAVNGLSTLKAFGRERRQVRRIGALTDDYRVQTMKVLQVSFLSGFALEMAASLSVAIVAVFIGVRLVSGALGLETGLFLLLVAPEVFLPLRLVGANYHAAADGVAAFEEVAGVLEQAPDGRPPVAVRPPTPPAAAAASVVLRGVSVAYDGITVLGPVDAEFAVGEVTAVTGPSGVGKTTLLAAVMGVVAAAGSVTWRGSDLPPARADVAWAGQRPGLLSGTVESNVALGASGDSVASDEVLRALRTAGAEDVDVATVVGADGSGLSGGQAQRVAVARAVYRVRTTGARLLLVDEPSSALDPAAEARLVRGLREVASEGVAVVVVTHRPAVAASADRLVAVEAPRATRPAVVGAPGSTEVNA